MARQIRLYVSLGLVGCKKEDKTDLPDDWDEMTEKQQEEYLDEEAQMFRDNNIEYGASVIEED